MNLKFGVIYAQKGQWTDDEFFSNQETSESFENFLNLLGEKITLKNWDRYRGGLDVHNNMTGSESVYTLFEDHQIMFHVSTLLPYTQEDTQQVRLPGRSNLCKMEEKADSEKKNCIPIRISDSCKIYFFSSCKDLKTREQVGNEQTSLLSLVYRQTFQVERKRHIGNDIVNIVFMEGEPEDAVKFQPKFVKSHFTHIYAVVTHSDVNNQDTYSLTVFSDESVPVFGPLLSKSNTAQEFRRLLLTKCINGEKAT